jgi:curved DNA-binding protein CbpA
VKTRQAARAWDRLLGLDGPEELWTSRDAVRSDVLNALRHATATAGPWHEALLAAARRRGVTAAYIVDRALVFRAALEAQGEPDLYAILGVPSDATPETIRRRWRVLAKRHHPDGDGATRADAFRRAQAAYAVLGNAVERMRYDARHRNDRPTYLQIEAHETRKVPLGPRAGWVYYAMWGGAAAVLLFAGLRRPAPAPEVVVAPAELRAAPGPAVEHTPPAAAPAPPAAPRRRAASRRMEGQKSMPAAAAPEVVPVAVSKRQPETPPAPALPAKEHRPRRGAIDEAAARGFLREFSRRYEGGEAIGLLELFASNGAANGRRGVEIAEAYTEFFRRLQPRYTTGRVRVRVTPSGATVESELVLSMHGRPPMHGVAYWDLVREGGRVRLARLVSSLPAL